MSRRYGMFTTIIFNSKAEMPPTPEDKEALEEAMRAVWPQIGSLDEGTWTDAPRSPGAPTYPALLAEYSEGTLFGGDAEGELTYQLALSVWEHFGHYVRMQVDIACLEDPPFETHTVDEEDYASWKGSN